MFVVASWISFVVKPDVVPGRMALLITIVLVQLNLFNNAKNKAPVSTSNINAIEAYLVSSMFLVFSALAEYAAILVMMRVLPTWTLQIVDASIYKRKSTLAWDSSTRAKCNDMENANNSNQGKLTSTYDRIRIIKKRGQNPIDKENIDDIKRATEYICNKIDVISLCLAPVIFSLFHVAYCVKYFYLESGNFA